MNKNKQTLYLSGLISEEQLAETSDFEHSLALAQKMQNDFENLAASLEGCLDACAALEKQASDNYAFHDKAGMERVDSQGVGDAQYFEYVWEHVSKLTKSLEAIINHHNSSVHVIEQGIDDLIKRLEEDV